LVPVEAYIAQQPSPGREMLDYLYQLFTRQDLKAKMSYGIPFYYGNKWVCYTNYRPQKGLEVCFTRAHEFTDPTGLLQAHNRKMIKGISYRHLTEIDEAALLLILEKALKLDQKT
jgi:hypothetical protein